MINIIKEKKFRVLVVSIITGIVLTIIEFMIIRFMIRGTTEWTIEMGNTLFNIMLVLTLAAFLITGLIFFRNMTRKEIAQSALIVVGYYIFFLVFERVVFGIGVKSLIQLYIWLCYPLRLYTTITQLVGRMFSNAWLGAILSLPSPLLYVVFGRKKLIKNREMTNRLLED